MSLRSKFLGLCFTFLGTHASLALSNSETAWPTWQAKWDGDYWKEGSFDNSIRMSCFGVDGSVGSPKFWSEGFGNYAARDAYLLTLDWVNVADRNPAYIEVYCGY